MPERLPPASPLPADAIALHIGIHKTGTTALQAALADARPELAGHGVLYPGRKTAHHGAAMTVLERPWGWAGKGGKAPDPHYFDRLAREARRHRGRVLLSSEQFCEADDRAAARVIDALGPDRTHLCIESLIGQLVHTLQVDRIRCSGQEPLLSPHNLPRMVRHITRFSAGGIRSLREEADPR